MDLVDDERGSEATVDLEARTIAGIGNELVEFSFDELARYRLLNGLDEIGMTLEHEDAIAAYEQAHAPLKYPRAGVTGIALANRSERAGSSMLSQALSACR